MTNSCPKCSDVALVAFKRGASKCPQCSGMFLTRAAAAAGEYQEAADASTSNDAQGARCPADGVIMSRAEVQVGDHAPIHLERCSSCGGVWFDAGEWTTLAEAQLLNQLDEFWTAEWRAAQRRRQTQENYDRRNREELGDDLYAQLEALAGKLRGHERRSQALAFLREASSA